MRETRPAGQQPLDNISIVIVDARTPANIGAAARSMMNMGLSRLVLVRPPRDPQGEARRLAAGADAILDRAALFDSLSDAIAGQSLVFGATRHAGRLRKNMNTARQAAASSLPLLEANRVCIVFGNEINGLEKEDLKLCHEFICIPSSASFPSLNLSHAVMVVAYEFFIASLSGSIPMPANLASGRDLEQLYDHLEKTLGRIGFLDKARSNRMMFSLRQLFGRARLENRDVKILRGILTAIDRTADNGKHD